MTLRNQDQHISVVRLGRSEYRRCWELQKQLQARRIARELGDLLLLTEHEPVITMGASANADHLLAADEQLAREGIDVVPVDRGGDVTYHGPGQLVGYPIFDLTLHGQDLHRYLRQLEELVIVALGIFHVSGSRVDGYTGVWVGKEKICAIGINVRRWVTTHGFALNVKTDLPGFRYIIPCGIFEHGVTSIAGVLGRDVGIDEAEHAVLETCEQVFHRTVHETTCKELGIDRESLQRSVTDCI